MSDQGITYATFVEHELKAERERRMALDVRGQGLVTTSGALVTLLGGLAALVKTGTAARFSPLVLTITCGALAAFALAAGCGIVASWNRFYAVAKASTLVAMLDEHWTDDEVDARNNVAKVHIMTVDTLRVANQFKARWVSIGLIVQLGALILLSAAVIMVITRN